MKLGKIKGFFRLIPSLVVAFYLVIPTLNQLIVHINPSTEGLMARLYLLGGVVSVITAIQSKKNKFSLPFFIILFTIVFLYLTAVDHGAENELTIPFFIMFAVLPLMLPQFIKVNAKVLALTAMILPSFGVLYLTDLFVFSSEGVIEMDLTYSLLVPIISTLIYLFLYWQDDTWKCRLIIFPFVIANVVYFVYIALFGSRAPTMSVVLCFLFLYIFHHRRNSRGIQTNKRRMLSVLILLVVVVASFISIVNGLDKFLEQYGIDSGTLEKLSRLRSDGDLSNGRSSLVRITWEAIKKSPVYGYGMSSSHRIIYAPYPHNFILQFLLEGGFLLGLIMLVPMFRYLFRWWKRCDYNDFALISLLLFSSLIGALFSMDIWMNPRLWLFFGFLLSNKMTYNNLTVSYKSNY